MKTRSLKSRNTEIFRKGFAPGDGPKIGHFSIFLFQQRPGKWVERYWRLQKREVQKVLILIFFQRGQSMVLVLNSPFFHLFILGNIEKSVFHGILKRQNAFFGSKNKKFKKSKNRDFFKRGQSMVSVQNWPFFHVFILGNIGQENVFYNILERKNAFLGYKNEKFKKSKK